MILDGVRKICWRKTYFEAKPPYFLHGSGRVYDALVPGQSRAQQNNTSAMGLSAVWIWSGELLSVSFGWFGGLARDIEERKPRVDAHDPVSFPSGNIWCTKDADLASAMFTFTLGRITTAIHIDMSETKAAEQKQPYLYITIYIYIPLKTKLECGFGFAWSGPFGPPPTADAF